MLAVSVLHPVLSLTIRKHYPLGHYPILLYLHQGKDCQLRGHFRDRSLITGRGGYETVRGSQMLPLQKGAGKVLHCLDGEGGGCK